MNTTTDAEMVMDAALGLQAEVNRLRVALYRVWEDAAGESHQSDAKVRKQIEARAREALNLEATDGR